MESAPSVELDAFFLQGRRFSSFLVHLWPTASEVRGSVLFLPPFAEEMNKARRMAALQARLFAARGYRVLLLDPTGCGDSTGDFGDADWEDWLHDAGAACDWLLERAPQPLTVWGLRLGASLAVDLARRREQIRHLILWHPVANGNLYLNQFLRIRLGSEMLTAGRTTTATQELRNQLASGKPVEVGGYPLSPKMAVAIGAIQLSEMPPSAGVHWFEVSSSTQLALSPASKKVVENWQAKGTRVYPTVVRCEPFWTTQEIAECPDLLDATLAALPGVP